MNAELVGNIRGNPTPRLSLGRRFAIRMDGRAERRAKAKLRSTKPTPTDRSKRLCKRIKQEKTIGV